MFNDQNPVGFILLYKGKDWLGNVLDYFQHGDFCHAAMIYNFEKIVRQNPGGPGLEDFDKAPWADIEIGRLNLENYPNKPAHVPDNPHEDQRFVLAFYKANEDHRNDMYAYEAIQEFLKEEQLIDIGLRGVANIMRQHQVPFFNNHRNVCSAYVAIVLEEAVRDAFAWPEFKFNSSIPNSQERPVDLRTSPVYFKISA